MYCRFETQVRRAGKRESNFSGKVRNNNIRPHTEQYHTVRLLLSPEK